MSIIVNSWTHSFPRLLSPLSMLALSLVHIMLLRSSIPLVEHFRRMTRPTILFPLPATILERETCDRHST